MHDIDRPLSQLHNHIALVIDASASMRFRSDELIKVVDAEIAHLAARSQELDQETRITVYTFNHEVRCLFYDTDVLRLPSIARYYRADGMTALVDATMKSQLDLTETAQLYGDHAFLTYVMTDGQENRSRHWRSSDLANHLARQPDNWTVACLVPDQRGVFEAKKHGFSAGNVTIWDATTGRGVTEAVTTTIRHSTETFMSNRARGVRGTKTLFAGGAAQINAASVRVATGVTPLGKDTYLLYSVTEEAAIRPYVEKMTTQPYRSGSAYYELTKPEKIQPQKSIMVRNRKSGRVYTGPDARKLLGLPDHEVRVKPEGNPEFQIFVQSTSVNRKLVPGTKLLVVK